MPHEHVQLAQAPNGELGPRCHACGMRLTFGNAMVVDKYYSAGNTMSKRLEPIQLPKSAMPMNGSG